MAWIVHESKSKRRVKGVRVKITKDGNSSRTTVRLGPDVLEKTKWKLGQCVEVLFDHDRQCLGLRLTKKSGGYKISGTQLRGNISFCTPHNANTRILLALDDHNIEGWEFHDGILVIPSPTKKESVRD